MPKRRQLDRERLEVYLVYLLVAYRGLIIIFGLVLLVYAFVSLFVYSSRVFMPAIAGLVPAVFLLLLGMSDNMVVYTAKLGAWIGTLWREDA